METITIDHDALTYEAVPAQIPERELAALIAALAQREHLAVIE